MAKKDRVNVSEMKGLWAVIPTPAIPGSERWDVGFTVDLDETARMVNQLVDAGVDGILSLGTLGECATLTWEEKHKFMATIVEELRGRVRYFGGTTSLNTRESIRQTREAAKLGVDGTMLGPPMWCAPDVATTIQFYKDVAEACPDTAICVYANTEAFKFDFPRPFWAQAAEIPQIVSAKYVGIANLQADVRMVKGRIRLMPNDTAYYAAARIEPEHCVGFWSAAALCGPNPAKRLRDEVARAKTTHDWKAAESLAQELAAIAGRFLPNGSFAEFSKYNIGLEKARMNAAGWIKAGPCRPPYFLIPEAYLSKAEEAGRMLADLHVRTA